MSSPGRVTEFANSSGAITALLSNFDVGVHLLKQEHQNWLASNVVSKLQTGGSIWLAGLTSTTGTEGRNQILSDNRANSVVNFLTTRLARNFPVKLEAKFSFGEAPARLSGSPDSFEDMRWRAVLVSAWDRSTPPPPPPPPPAPEPVCKRTVVGDSGGVHYYVFLDGGPQQGKLIEQGGVVKASPEYLSCATVFERRRSFIAGGWGSRPVLLSYAVAAADGAVGEAIGHVFQKVNRFSIMADKAAIAHLPKPFNTEFSGVPIEGFLTGAYIDNHNDFHLLAKVPLFLSDDTQGGRYISIANSSEDAPRYDVITDIDGEILASFGNYASSYPRSESMLSVGVKAGVKKLVWKFAKSLIL
jgi:hypothetical protein